MAFRSGNKPYGKTRFFEKFLHGVKFSKYRGKTDQQSAMFFQMIFCLAYKSVYCLISRIKNCFFQNRQILIFINKTK